MKRCNWPVHTEQALSNVEALDLFFLPQVPQNLSRRGNRREISRLAGGVGFYYSIRVSKNFLYFGCGVSIFQGFPPSIRALESLVLISDRENGTINEDNAWPRRSVIGTRFDALHSIKKRATKFVSALAVCSTG